MGKYYSNIKLFHGIADFANFAPVFIFLDRGKYYSNVKLFHGIADFADFAPVFSFLNRGKILFKYEPVSRNRGFRPFCCKNSIFEPWENIFIITCLLYEVFQQIEEYVIILFGRTLYIFVGDRGKIFYHHRHIISGITVSQNHVFFKKRGPKILCPNLARYLNSYCLRWIRAR